MVMFAACSDEPQEVKIVGYDVKASKVASVTVETSNDYILITWDAVENGTDYYIYDQKEKSKTVSTLYNGNNITNNLEGPDNYGSFNSSTGVWTNGTDPDKWSFLIHISWFTGYNGSYRFGVQTIDADPNKSASDIKWSDYKQITAPAE
jgi:hypothetical protein